MSSQQPPEPGGPAAAAPPPATDASPLSADEIIDIVDEHDTVIGQSPRGAAYARGLRHRCAFILARDAADRIFVHRRTARKLVFPSLYDMFVGGVVGAGESYDRAALREAEEELGVSGLPQPEPLFRFLYEDGPRSWWSTVYQVRCEMPVSPQPEEVAWHTFLTEDELAARLPDWEWVPDGLAAYRRLLALRGGSGDPAVGGSSGASS
ncbi:Isopentenyldiphosphate isomerase [Streptomyces sp. DvalAA-14]|uniref:NUDIX hydrolase n=1 Tax=unclassified Streptomyces TaxID=2593676 RepID=UPI00081B3630|nr:MULTISPECIES: NUDIX domain-containing protein [unclassified Streptomyces]MYS21944.1 NUDIX domain-containing protein [Streptomyces sp. SID4948]SCE04985.1 Isopentenyldiphosphate isomerase [Streptomyces sp. DvalAA-14]